MTSKASGSSLALRMPNMVSGGALTTTTTAKTMGAGKGQENEQHEAKRCKRSAEELNRRVVAGGVLVAKPAMDALLVDLLVSAQSTQRQANIISPRKGISVFDNSQNKRLNGPRPNHKTTRSRRDGGQQRNADKTRPPSTRSGRSRWHYGQQHGACSCDGARVGRFTCCVGGWMVVRVKNGRGERKENKTGETRNRWQPSLA